MAARSPFRFANPDDRANCLDFIAHSPAANGSHGMARMAAKEGGAGSERFSLPAYGRRSWLDFNPVWRKAMDGSL